MVTLLSPFTPIGHYVLSPLTHLLTLRLPFIFWDISLLRDSPGLPESPIWYLSLQLTCHQPMQPSSKNPNAVFLL